MKKMNYKVNSVVAILVSILLMGSSVVPTGALTATGVLEEGEDHIHFDLTLEANITRTAFNMTKRWFEQNRETWSSRWNEWKHRWEERHREWTDKWKEMMGGWRDWARRNMQSRNEWQHRWREECNLIQPVWWPVLPLQSEMFGWKVSNSWHMKEILMPNNWAEDRGLPEERNQRFRSEQKWNRVLWLRLPQ